MGATCCCCTGRSGQIIGVSTKKNKDTMTKKAQDKEDPAAQDPATGAKDEDQQPATD